MHRQILIDCWPFLAAIAASVAVLWLLVRLSGARLRLAQFRHLHGDQHGGVQSLAFVLTLPLFIIVLMFIVQLSQITIAQIVVEYSAFSSARSAMVWIPADLGTPEEGPNQISTLTHKETTNEDGYEWNRYEVDENENSVKYQQIHLAAAMACLPICPSRDVGVARNHPSNDATPALQEAYRLLSPQTAGNQKIPERVANKLAYALENTKITLEVRHKDKIEDNGEVPLMMHDVGPDREEYRFNEVGWQDQITVKVEHDFALLPGPARILARKADAPPGTSPEASYGTDDVAQSLTKKGSVYVYTLEATARLSNEGEKPAIPYVQPIAR